MEDWITRCYKRIKNIVYGRAQSFKIDPEDLLSAVQNNLARANKNNGFVGETEDKFIAFCQTVIYNAAINHRRFDNKKNDRLISVHTEGGEKLIESKQAEHYNFDQKDLVKEIFDWLKVELPKKKNYKAVFDYFFIDGLKYEEVAMETKIPCGTVKTIIHQIRKMIKENYGDQYEDVMFN